MILNAEFFCRTKKNSISILTFYERNSTKLIKNLKEEVKEGKKKLNQFEFFGIFGHLKKNLANCI